MSIELIVTGVLVLVLVFLSTIESAYESLSEVSLRVLGSEREDSPRRAGFLRELMEHRRRFEMILVLGTQLSIAAIAILLTDVFIDTGLRAPLLLALVAVFAVVMLFRQLVPRLFTQNHPDDVFWTLLPPLEIFYRFFSVFVAPLAALLNRMRAEEPEAASAEDEAEEGKEEIQAFIDVGEEAGIIEESEGELIQSIIEFSETRVDKVMRPRPQIVAIEASATVADARQLMIESKHSRIPVYRDQIDTIEGIVYVRDLLALCDTEKMSMRVTGCMRPAYFVPESKSVRELLEDMQKAKVQISIVIDEYGGVAGLVTLEDIIEEILGEIEDEDEGTPAVAIVQSEDGSYLIDGGTEIRKVELLYDKELEADDFTTVAGLIVNQLGHVPAVGETLDFKGLRLEVVDADSKHVNRVRLRLIDEPASDRVDSTAAVE
ncbi:MAG TPA: hemolysin family protein [Blastocatellia bacterium]|nr:hemolysin family protein [Blastocatellia bacterium]